MESIVIFIIGILCIVIGILNRKGHISMLHSYHRKRVSEEDRIPFGKIVGLGMIIIGIGLIIMAGLFLTFYILQKEIYMIIGIIIIAISIFVGLGIAFYGMIKYNKGIF